MHVSKAGNGILPGMQPSIVLVGHVCIDHNISEHAQYESWGSSALYMATYWQQKQQLKPTILTTHGEDFSSFAAGFQLLPTAPSTANTLVFENNTKAGHRTQRCLHADSAQPPILDDHARQTLANADAVVVAPLIANYPAAFVRDVLQASNPNAVKVFVPQGYFRQITPEGQVQHQLSPTVDELIPLFDVTIYSKEDRETPLEYAQQLTQNIDAAIVVTQGPAGASVVQHGQSTHIPTVPVAEEDIVDSVGCGDTFAAGLAHALLAGKSIQAAVEDAHQAARQKLFSTPS
jgi:sugar/nucleoside kinase (ribokinase family)